MIHRPTPCTSESAAEPDLLDTELVGNEFIDHAIVIARNGIAVNAAFAFDHFDDFPPIHANRLKLPDLLPP